MPELADPLTTLRGVGPELAKKFAALGIHSTADLIDTYPRRYEDYSQVDSIRHLKPGIVTIKAVIKQVTGRYVRRGMHVTEAVASDETGSVRLIWFNQPYRAAALKPASDYYISGDFGLRRQRLSIMSPSVELASELPVNTARILPVYKETKGLKSYQIRKCLQAVRTVIQALPETLPPWVVKQYRLPSYAAAMESLHFPASSTQLEAARKRLGFEEVFALSLAALYNKYELQQAVAVAIPFDVSLAREFVGHLPFQLTPPQRQVVWQIYGDMARTSPMNRLVEGDVGSGKTVVAAMAAIMAMRQGFQAVLMAPTELLARQHADTLHALLTPLGMAERLSLLVGGQTAAQKKSVYRRVTSGDVGFLVGTHAVIQEKVDMHRLGLVIVDEQHRFGVEQRKALQAKAGHMPHVLSLTATPIPRSLALTLYGELDISVIDTKPAGRQPIITRLCSPNSRAQLYASIEAELAAGRQMFVVTPLIANADDDAPDTSNPYHDKKPATKLRSAEQVYDDLRQGAFKHRRIGLLHGKLKPAEKDQVMQKFVRHELDILVATTVIEVGVNVPNATVMLIENAERFGLAQIHQLRGRVGRSDHQGYAYLMLGDSAAPSRRLRALEQTNDGFTLAELDLELRGPGAIYGTMQHGQLDLRIAKLSDAKLIAAARASAQSFIDRRESLVKYSRLQVRVQTLRAVTNLN